MNFEVPLVTNMHPEPPPAGSSAAARFNGITQGWSATNDGEDSMEVNIMFFLTLIMYIKSHNILCLNKIN
jgi:hypothetical protein